MHTAWFSKIHLNDILHFIGFLSGISTQNTEIFLLSPFYPNTQHIRSLLDFVVQTIKVTHIRLEYPHYVCFSLTMALTASVV
jgi:hypothetical protein